MTITTILSELGECNVTAGSAGGLWLAPDQAIAATGWALKPEGFCRGDICVPVPATQAETFVAAGKVNLAAFWDHMDMPTAHSDDGDVWVLGEGADNRAATLRSLDAPDFTLSDLAGVAHSLSDYRGKKVLLATWASWCGCRQDLGLWQELYDELKEQNFTVIAVAMDSRVDAARPWIEASKPSYPALIDWDHRVSDLYNMVNVPQAVWIDEGGRIVRPTENAGAYESFRSLDMKTMTIPEDKMTIAADAKATYVNAIRDWVRLGSDSDHAYSAGQANAHTAVPTSDIAQAHCHFRLGQFLLRQDREVEGRRHLAEASRLHPASWNIWRQAADVNEIGLAAGPDFWARVNALGNDYYYPPVDMAEMPA